MYCILPLAHPNRALYRPMYARCLCKTVLHPHLRHTITNQDEPGTAGNLVFLAAKSAVTCLSALVRPHVAIPTFYESHLFGVEFMVRFNAHVTRGKAMTLSSSCQLVGIILGGAQEDIALERLMICCFEHERKEVVVGRACAICIQLNTPHE